MKNNIDWPEFIGNLKKGKFLYYLFKFKIFKLYVYSLECLPRPLLVHLILLFFSTGNSKILDSFGRVRKVNIFNILKCLFIFAFSLSLLMPIYVCITCYVSFYKYLNKSFPILKPQGSVVYLRTDFWFGLKSGGSVAHTSGVLNALFALYKSQLTFITTDYIPNVNKNINQNLYKLPKLFWDFPQFTAVASNVSFFRQSINLISISRSEISFIYHRYSLNCLFAPLLAKTCCCPLVLEFNGSEVWVANNWGDKLNYPTLSKKIENFNLKESDLIVVVSKVIQDQLILRGIDPRKILVNPNGVDPEHYSPTIDASMIIEKYELSDKLVIGFIGTFGRWHGAEVLAEAFGQLLLRLPTYKDYLHLLMIGDGMTLPFVKNIISKYDLDSCCTFTGVVPQAEGPSYLAACEILVSPHVTNPDGTAFFGSPTKLFEYMAMGKAIIASDLDQIGEILSHNLCAWLVKPGDVDDLTAGLERLVADQSLRYRLGSSARDKVIKKYTWLEHGRRIKNKLDECYGV
jgi:glycosyltransferase involved in cell wall biosynthesis